MKTLDAMLKLTTKDRVANSKFVKITKKPQAGYDQEGYGFIAAQMSSTHKFGPDGKIVKNYNQNKYVALIRFLDTKGNVQVSCSCADNTFRWEVANTKKGASEIEYSNGQAPIMTNPRNNPGLCKHLYVLGKLALPHLKKHSR